MWQILREVGIPLKLINLIKMCLDNSQCKVRIGNRTSDPFHTKSGLRQGCILSPVLFSIAMEKITRTIMNRPEGMAVGDTIIKDLAYADDIDLIAPSVEDLSRLASDLNEMGKRIGLKVNEEKTKIMKLTRGDNHLNEQILIVLESSGFLL